MNYAKALPLLISKLADALNVNDRTINAMIDDSPYGCDKIIRHLDLMNSKQGTIPMYHLIKGSGTEYLTESDTTAQMASIEGLDVFTDLEPEEINPLLEYHTNWREVPVK